MTSARVNLDHVSVAPLRAGALEVMIDELERGPADPSRTYSEALGSRARLEVARTEVAAALEARPREIVFTSGRAESIATVVQGVAGHQIASNVEHAAVREGVGALDGALIGADGFGRVSLESIQRAVTPETRLVHLQWANHEVGTRQATQPVAEWCRTNDIHLHIDASVGAGHDPVSFAESGADFMTVEASGFGGPPGIGALIVRRGIRIKPLIVGGDQERARRAGLENVASARAMATALSEAVSDLDRERERERRLTDELIDVALACTGASTLGDPVDRVPHLVCVTIDDVEPQAVVLGLDRRGIATHSGNSCSSESLEPSPVLDAMGADAHRSLRLSVGWSSLPRDVAALSNALAPTIEQLRSLRPH